MDVGFRAPGKLFRENGRAEIAGLHALSDAKLEDLEDFVHRSARFQRIPDVSRGSRSVDMRERGVESNAERAWRLSARPLEAPFKMTAI